MTIPEPSPVTLEQTIEELENALGQDNTNSSHLNILTRHIGIYTGDENPPKELITETILPLLQKAKIKMPWEYQLVIQNRIQRVRRNYKVA